MKKILLALTFAMLFLIAQFSFADVSALPPQDFFAQVLQAIHDFGGLPWVGKIALIVALVIASMKVSFLDDLVWNRLGKFQAWLAPVLGLVGGILGLAVSGQPFSWARAFAYMSAGAGAVILHELLDTAKAIPGLGPIWVQVIAVIEGVLGGNPVSTSDAKKPA